jgi:short subunit dehydrogenase-like uncharacterized protein
MLSFCFVARQKAVNLYPSALYNERELLEKHWKMAKRDRMQNKFLLYGSTGFVGSIIAKKALQNQLQPIIAGRNTLKVHAQAEALDVESRVFDLSDSGSMEKALREVPVVLNCAGPYVYTAKNMVDACLRTGVHYLDLTGEIPVYEQLAARDNQAKARKIMLLPGVGFDVVPSDCLAVHLKNRLPAADRLTIAFISEGPAGLPPGTARTMIEMAQFGIKVRENGIVKTCSPGLKTRIIDFGDGPRKVTRLTWGDIFTAYYSTGIASIEEYSALSENDYQSLAISDAFKLLFRLKIVRNLFMNQLKSGSTEAERKTTRSVVWGEVQDSHGHKAISRLYGPDAGVTWTSMTALSVVKEVLTGNFEFGYQTPARVYGPDFVLNEIDVRREDVE